MRPEHYKQNRPMKKEKAKGKGEANGSQSRVAAATQEGKPITSPKLLEAYSTKIEWIRKLIPKLKEEAEAPEKKE
jgi:hypothetical protein